MRLPAPNLPASTLALTNLTITLRSNTTAICLKNLGASSGAKSATPPTLLGQLRYRIRIAIRTASTPLF